MSDTAKRLARLERARVSGEGMTFADFLLSLNTDGGETPQRSASNAAPADPGFLAAMPERVR